MKINPFAAYSGARLNHLSARQRDLIRTISGRSSVIIAIAVFAVCYALGIIHFGIMAGMTIGWLPSAIFAWLSAHSIFQLLQSILPVLLTLQTGAR